MPGCDSVTGTGSGMGAINIELYSKSVTLVSFHVPRPSLTNLLILLLPLLLFFSFAFLPLSLSQFLSWAAVSYAVCQTQSTLTPTSISSTSSCTGPSERELSERSALPHFICDSQSYRLTSPAGPCCRT